MVSLHPSQCVLERSLAAAEAVRSYLAFSMIRKPILSWKRGRLVCLPILTVTPLLCKYTPS